MGLWDREDMHKRWRALDDPPKRISPARAAGFQLGPTLRSIALWVLILMAMVAAAKAFAPQFIKARNNPALMPSAVPAAQQPASMPAVSPARRDVEV